MESLYAEHGPLIAELNQIINFEVAESAKGRNRANVKLGYSLFELGNFGEADRGDLPAASAGAVTQNRFALVENPYPSLKPRCPLNPVSYQKCGIAFPGEIVT